MMATRDERPDVSDDKHFLLVLVVLVFIGLARRGPGRAAKTRSAPGPVTHSSAGEGVAMKTSSDQIQTTHRAACRVRRV